MSVVDAMARDIPGFYYDEVKRKYFRIQQSHRTVPGTGYTSQSIAALEQVKQGQRRAQEQANRERAGKINRSRLFHHTSSPLSARLGASLQQNRHEILKQYAAGLSYCYVDGDSRSQEPPPGTFYGSSFSITRTGLLRTNIVPQYTGHNARRNSHRRSPTDQTVDPPTHLTLSNFYNRTPHVAQLIVSVYESSLADSECAVISTDGSPMFTIKPVNSTTGVLEHLYIEMNISTGGVETIWDICSAPSSPRFALATDIGLMLGQIRENNATSIISSRNLSRKEQMNVSFKDANVVMSGERSGRINFSDVRTGSSVVRLLHSSAVLGTLSLRDGNHVLAHGYNTTSTYDLRFVKQVPVHKKARFSDLNLHSKSYVDFAVPLGRHTDRYTRGRKIAHSADLDFVVAASANSSSSDARYVTLYDVRSGRVLDSPLTRFKFQDDVVCVDVRRVRDGVESIICLAGEEITEWSPDRLGVDELKWIERGKSGEKGTCAVWIEDEWNRGNRGPGGGGFV